MEQGWVYVLVNSSMPGLAKVGRSTRPPPERAAELSAATGVATPFIVAYQHKFADCDAAESKIHAVLSRRGLRVAHNREFFRGPVADIINVILQTTLPEASEAAPEPEQDVATLLQKGENHLLGRGETLQDISAAAHYFQLAERRGSLLAGERLGALYSRIAGRTGRRRAMRTLKEVAAKGNYFAYCEMAAIFARERHVQNFIKSWDLFFAGRGNAFLAEVETGQERYLGVCRAYIAGCLELGLQPGHLAELRAEGPQLLAGLEANMELARASRRIRSHYAKYLRWARQNLPPPAERPGLIHAARTRLRGWLGHADRDAIA